MCMKFWVQLFGVILLHTPPPTPLPSPSSNCSCISSILGVMNVFNKHSGSMGLMKVMEDAAATRV